MALHLVALQPPDEVPHRCERGVASIASAFAASSCARFSPKSRCPAASASRTASTLDLLRHRDERHVVRRRARLRAPRPRCGRAPRPAARRPSLMADGHGSTTIVAWRPVTPSRRYEKCVGRRRRCTRRRRRTRRRPQLAARRATPRPGCRARDGRRRVRPSTLGSEPRDEARRDRPRRTRSARGGCTGRGYARTGPVPIARSRGDRGLDHAVLEPAVAGVHDAHRVVARERRSGAQSAVSTASGSPGVAVTAASASGGSAAVGSDRDVHRGAVHLADPHPAAPDRRARPRRRRAPGSRQRRRAGRRRGRRRCTCRTARRTPPARSLHHTRAGPTRRASAARGPVTPAG